MHVKVTRAKKKCLLSYCICILTTWLWVYKYFVLGNQPKIKHILGVLPTAQLLSRVRWRAAQTLNRLAKSSSLQWKNIFGFGFVFLWVRSYVR